MTLTIGKLAKQSKVTIETIRYYQNIGLLSIPTKPESGYRLYSSEEIKKIRFIKRAQLAGFALKEVKELLALDGTHCHDVRLLAEQKCLQIDHQIDDLMSLRKTLLILVKSCGQSISTDQCAILDTLNSENTSPIDSLKSS